MLLLNINFTSILSQILRPASAPAENKPLAVLGKFYSRLFGYLANLIDAIKEEEEAPAPELVVNRIANGITWVREIKNNRLVHISNGVCSCGEADCRHIQFIQAGIGTEPLIKYVPAKTKIKSPALRKMAAGFERSWELVEF